MVNGPFEDSPVVMSKSMMRTMAKETRKPAVWGETDNKRFVCRQEPFPAPPLALVYDWRKRTSPSRVAVVVETRGQTRRVTDNLHLLWTMASVRTMILGCGSVKNSMGWYHAKQIIDGRIAGVNFWTLCGQFAVEIPH